MNIVLQGIYDYQTIVKEKKSRSRKIQLKHKENFKKEVKDSKYIRTHWYIKIYNFKGPIQLYISHTCPGYK